MCYRTGQYYLYGGGKLLSPKLLLAEAVKVFKQVTEHLLTREIKISTWSNREVRLSLTMIIVYEP